MKELFLSLVLLLGTGGIAMAGCPVSGSNVSGTLANGSIQVTISSIGTITVPFSDLGQGSVQTKAAALQQILQNYFDVRQPLSSLPVDDPDRYINPDLPNIFWSDANGVPQIPETNNTHLTGRNCVIDITVVGSGANTTVGVNFSSP